jgi:YVTN family beta-propeller protein
MLPATVTTVSTVTVGRRPSGIAAGDGAVWVTDAGDDAVTRIDLASGSEATIAVGHGPTGITVDGTDVWVANSDDGTVSEIDATGRRVVATIDVGNRPTGIAVAGGRVWVSVQATT